MAKVAITEQYLTDIADAIRSKTGESSATYYPSEMASAILTIGGSVAPTIQSLNITPSESAQTFNSSSVDGYKPVTVAAVSSTYVGSGITQRSSTDLTVSDATVTVPAGYYSTQASKSVSTMTLPTSAAAAATSGYSSKATISRSTSAQYINIPPGYNSTGAYYVVSAVANGSASAPTSISGSSATVTTGTNTLTLTKTVSVTPVVSAGYVSSGTATNSSVSLTASVTVNPTPTASGATVTIPAGYYSSQTTKSVTSGSATGPSSLSGTSATVSTGTNTLTLTKTGVTTTPTVSAGYVSSATSSTATVTLTASVTTKAAATITPGTTNQTIAAGIYLTGAQTISGDSNLVAGNIKDGVPIFGITGTYTGEGGGGGSDMTVATATKTLSTAAASISFTGLAGEPTSFVITSDADLTTGASPYKTAAVVFDGSSLHGQTITNTNNEQVNYDGTNFSKTYSNGTLTVSGSTYFQANTYKLVYTYGGSSSNIDTADTQVGSGATSITFTGLTDEPSYFSCIFKSDFTTSSGYQRVITVVYDGDDVYGLAMDSEANVQTSWSYTYNNGSLTITSQGTNNGGYFHQPGYYQLTYGIGGAVAPVEIEVESLSVTQNGTYTAPSGKAYSPVVVNVAGSGGDAKFVTGTFTTGSSTSTNETFTVSYSGSGYPIMLLIVVEGGMYNSSISGWYNSLTRYAVGQIAITKGVATSSPDYSTSGTQNYGCVELIYKNSTSTATSYSSTRSVTANSYSSSTANGTSTTCVRWTSNKVISYRTGGGGSSSYGLLASTTYRYYVYYSS